MGPLRYDPNDETQSRWWRCWFESCFEEHNRLRETPYICLIDEFFWRTVFHVLRLQETVSVHVHNLGRPSLKMVIQEMRLFAWNIDFVHVLYRVTPHRVQFAPGSVENQTSIFFHFQHLFNDAARRECVDIHCVIPFNWAFCVVSARRFSGILRRTTVRISAINARRKSWRMTRCAFSTTAQRQTSGLTVCESLHTSVQMQLSTGRRSQSTATPRGRPPRRRNDHDPHMPRKGRLRPGFSTLHMVERSWARSRSQMHRIRGKQPQLRNDMTSHWCSPYTLSPHSCWVLRDSCSAGPSLCNECISWAVHTRIFTALRSAQPSGLLVESWSSPRLLLLMVGRSWPRLRNQMLCIRKKLECDRLSRGTTRPLTDAATALGVCIYTEATLAVLDLRCEPSEKIQMRNAASARVCYLTLWEFSATLWFYPRIRGKIASLLSQRQG